jgi:pimeloyl-ACP methyl ester carboxylesterase
MYYSMGITRKFWAGICLGFTIVGMFAVGTACAQQLHQNNLGLDLPGGDRIDFPEHLQTPHQWSQHVAHLHEHMQAVMGELDRNEKDAAPVPLQMIVMHQQDLNGIRYQKIQYHLRTHHRMKAWLLTPVHASAANPIPAVLCLHQTNGRLGKDEPTGLGGNPELQYALELAQRGFATLSPDYPSFGDYEHDFREAPFVSGTMQAITENRRAIDLLQSLPEIDDHKIACIGHSLGGHNAIFTATFEPRIRAVVSSCGFTRFHRYMKGNLAGWTSDRYMPRIQSEYQSDPNQMPFDFPELIASLAPRGFLAVAPIADDNFDVQGVRESIEFASKAYAIYGASDSLQADYPDAQHTFPKDSRNRAYDFLEKQLAKSP